MNPEKTFENFCLHMKTRHPDITDEELKNLYKLVTAEPLPLSEKDLKRAREISEKFKKGEYKF